MALVGAGQGGSSLGAGAPGAGGGYHVAAFLAQQVAEKSLKAVLYHLGQEAVLGHSVERLAADVGSHFPEVRASAPRWATLDAHYVTSRYPNSVPGTIPARVYDRGIADAALQIAEQVVGFAEKVIGGG